eukprot:6179957-Pleurochrysis_carterae.AAC.2
MRLRLHRPGVPAPHCAQAVGVALGARARGTLSHRWTNATVGCEARELRTPATRCGRASGGQGASGAAGLRGCSLEFGASELCWGEGETGWTTRECEWAERRVGQAGG